MNVPPIRREVGERGVAGEERLDPALGESSLPADEQSRVVVGPRPKVALQDRDELPKQGFLAAVSTLDPPDANPSPLQVEVLALKEAGLGDPKAVEVDRHEEGSVTRASNDREELSGLLLGEVA